MQIACGDSWRELYRCDDLMQARAVATCIAAMEFDVRLRDRGKTDEQDAAEEACPNLSTRDFAGPFVIEVPDGYWLDLAGVLDQIIDEQMEFDQRLESRHSQAQPALIAILTIGTVAEIIAIMRLMDSS